VSSSNTSTARARIGTEFAIILLSISVLCVRLIDIGALFAARAAQLVAPEVIAKKKQVDAKNCCSIVSFGDYEGEQCRPYIYLPVRRVSNEIFLLTA